MVCKVGRLTEDILLKEDGSSVNGISEGYYSTYRDTIIQNIVFVIWKTPHPQETPVSSTPYHLPPSAHPAS